MYRREKGKPTRQYIGVSQVVLASEPRQQGAEGAHAVENGKHHPQCCRLGFSGKVYRKNNRYAA